MPDPQEAAAKGMRERDLLELVRDLARYRGWLVYHTHDSRRSEPGFPDLCLVRGDRVIFAELKASKGVLSQAQREWVAALTNARGVEVYVWRPIDWLTGAIEAKLR